VIVDDSSEARGSDTLATAAPDPGGAGVRDGGVARHARGAGPDAPFPTADA
jgi:hypothetical protein